MQDAVVYMMAALMCLLRGDSPSEAQEHADRFVELTPAWVTGEGEEDNGVN